MTGRVAYERGLHELGDGLYAYLQPDGGWGWSNAGLITVDGASLLVDTLFDLRLTAAMLETMAPLLATSPLSAAFNTHGNGDHCFGNQLLPGSATILATGAASTAMARRTPAAVRGMLRRRIARPAVCRVRARALRGVRLRRHRAAAARCDVRGPPRAARG